MIKMKRFSSLLLVSIFILSAVVINTAAAPMVEGCYMAAGEWSSEECDSITFFTNEYMANAYAAWANESSGVSSYIQWGCNFPSVVVMAAGGGDANIILYRATSSGNPTGPVIAYAGNGEEGGFGEGSGCYGWANSIED